jgi:hypothetical protein
LTRALMARGRGPRSRAEDTSARPRGGQRPTVI